MMLPLIRKRITSRQLMLIGYIVLIGLFWLTSYRSLSFDFIFILMLGAAMIMKRARQFVQDWLPIIMILFAYEAMRGLVDDLGWEVNITNLINTERYLFGGIPCAQLQALWHVTGVYRWYDYYFAALYGSFFFIPFVAGFTLWMKRRSYFIFLPTA